ncbi:MAG: hypothetical protein WC717_03545 [Candidatus Micrarchaeia archaeon]|jgi:hypothetical protein
MKLKEVKKAEYVPLQIAGRPLAQWKLLERNGMPVAKAVPAPNIEIKRLPEKDLKAIIDRIKADRVDGAKAALLFVERDEMILNALDIAEIFKAVLESDRFLPGLDADLAAEKLVRQDSLRAVFEVFLENPSESFGSYRRAREFPPNEAVAFADRILRLENDTNAYAAAKIIDCAPAGKRPRLYRIAAGKMMPALGGKDKWVAYSTFYSIMAMPAKQRRQAVCAALESRWDELRMNAMAIILWGRKEVPGSNLHELLIDAARLNGIRAVENGKSIVMSPFEDSVFHGMTFRKAFLFPKHLRRHMKRKTALRKLGEAMPPGADWKIEGDVTHAQKKKLFKILAERMAEATKKMEKASEAAETQAKDDGNGSA